MYFYMRDHWLFDSVSLNVVTWSSFNIKNTVSPFILTLPFLLEERLCIYSGRQIHTHP